MTHKESPLLGGRTAEGVVRVENTTRRSLNPNSELAHSLLKHLESVGFQYTPRFLGIDDKGREILSFIEGVVPHGEITWNDVQLAGAMKILREFHDATAKSDLKGESEVICHNDFAPWNIVLRNDSPVGIIDFDNVKQGERIEDVAYFLWTFLDLGSDTPVETQASKVNMLCNVYGLSNKDDLVQAIIKQQERILKLREELVQNEKDLNKRQFSVDAIKRIHREISWVKSNGETLITTQK